MEIGVKIKKRRTELQMTQEELAKRLHVSRAAISNWEVGRNYPDIQLLVQLSDELSLSLDELLREDTKMVQAMDKKIKKGAWIEKYWIIITTILTMTFVGYYSFDNWASILIFGIGTGFIFGMIIRSIGQPSQQ